MYSNHCLRACKQKKHILCYLVERETQLIGYAKYDEFKEVLITLI